MTTPPSATGAQPASESDAATRTPGGCPAHHGATDDHIAHCVEDNGHDGPHVAVDEKGDVAALWD